MTVRRYIPSVIQVVDTFGTPMGFYIHAGNQWFGPFSHSTRTTTNP